MLLCGILLPGCARTPPPATSAVAQLPEYTAADAALFGNTLSPSVFGQAPDRAPGEDPKLIARAEQADFIARTRVSTLTRDGLAGRELHTLTVVPEGPALRGALPGSDRIDLAVPRGSPTAARVERRGRLLTGKRLLLFGRAFQEGGERVLRWHGEPDTTELRQLLPIKALDGTPAPTQSAP